MDDDAASPGFTYFSDFPFDIRACIWRNLAFQPRNVDLWTQDLGTLAKSSIHPNEFALFRYVTTQPPPAVLQVNKESRTIGLKYYTLEFGSSHEIPGHYGLRLTSPPKTYVNLRCDRICLIGGFDSQSFPWVFDPRPKERIDRRLLQYSMRIAMNVVSSYLAFLPDEDDFIAACSPYEEVLLYYLSEEDTGNLKLPEPGERASVEFHPIDISTKGDRGLCFELHTRLLALHESSKNSEALNSRMAKLGLGSDEPHTGSKKVCPNVQWATLVIDGRKVGLQ